MGRSQDVRIGQENPLIRRKAGHLGEEIPGPHEEAAAEHETPSGPNPSHAANELEGATVLTIEGLSAHATHPVQQAWLAEQVTMCGYCEPGFIMAITALLEASPSPSEEQIAALRFAVA